MPVGDWIAAGKAGAKSVNDLFAVARDNSPDYGMIAKTGMNARSKERQVATKAKKDVINSAIAAEARVRQAEIKVDKEGEITDLKTSMKRKAGIVGALGAVAGGALMGVQNKQAAKREAARDAAETASWEKRMAYLKESNANMPEPFESTPFVATPWKPDSSGSGTSSGSDSSSGVTSDTTTPVSTFKPGAKLSQSQIQDLAVQVGFPSDVAPVISKIAMGESSGRSTAFNGKGADQSYGLMQINMLGDMGPERRKAFGLTSNEDLYDPLTNMKAAYEIYKTQGLEAWGAYTNGSYKKF